VLAEIDAGVGGRFSCFGGAISGKNLEVVRCTRLVQAWRVENWDEDVYSVVTFVLQEDGSAETKLVFCQAGFPDEHREHLNQGWYDKYWTPLKSYVEK
jgi:activator of HSP90 ATPase